MLAREFVSSRQRLVRRANPNFRPTAQIRSFGSVNVYGNGIPEGLRVRVLAFVLSIAVSLLATSCNRTDVGSSLAVIERPSNARQLKDTYKVALKDATPQRLRELKKEANNGLAISAAWREAFLDAASTNHSWLKLRFPAFTRFVGFVDGRLPVDLPEWWKLNIVAAKPSPAADVVFVPDEHFPPSESKGDWGYLQGVSATYANDGTALEKYNIELRSETGRYVLPVTLNERHRIPIASPLISTVLDPDSFFVVSGTKTRAEPAILIRFDQKSAKVLWEQELWIGRDLAGLSVADDVTRAHIVEPKVGRDGNVYVFGTFGSGAYIEAFSRADGAPLFRFSTAYLQQW
jgi:hypothetical protein